MKNDSDNRREVNIMTFITNKIILKKLSKHFLMIYSYSTCSKKIPLKIRLISVNELADGDLKMLVRMRDVLDDDELLFNLLFQTYISVATFQNLVKFVHKDAHFGNFLYQKNNEKGYYHYIFNGRNYYLKSCKYNIIIFDYGFAERIEDQDIATINADYFQIIHAFMNKITGWGNYRDLPKDKTNKTILEMSYQIDDMTKKTYRLPLQRSLFIDIIENIFLKYTPKDMFITQRPANILNEIPFRIE
jgi:predicted unusual protein kinase regulating ubiquinone biosynthesis (AarF/ABC1/UbiB family)